MMAATHNRSGAVNPKLASGFFDSEPAVRIRQTASLSVGTHQENAVFYRGVVSGCAVAPNSTDFSLSGGASASAGTSTGAQNPLFPQQSAANPGVVIVIYNGQSTNPLANGSQLAAIANATSSIAIDAQSAQMAVQVRWSPLVRQRIG
jgi:hypothetical protein